MNITFDNEGGAYYLFVYKFGFMNRQPAVVKELKGEVLSDFKQANKMRNNRLKFYESTELLICHMYFKTNL